MNRKNYKLKLSLRLFGADSILDKLIHCLGVFGFLEQITYLYFNW